MRCKRRRNCVSIRTLTFGINLLLLYLTLHSSCASASFYPDSVSSLHGTKLLFITGLATLQSLNLADASVIPTPQIPSLVFVENQNVPQFIENSTLQSNTSNDNEESQPRRLTELPKSRTKSVNRKMRQAPESAMNRARLLLGSLNRQNCFAKVLCGLGAREPTTKTGLLNDYVYLMEEFVLDDEPDDPKTKSKSKKRAKTKKKKVHTKKDKDDSDSSMSKSDEDDKKANDELEDKLTDWNFLADATLAQEDPQVLKYVQLEEKRRQYKDQLPNDLLLKRSGREEVTNGTNETKEGKIEKLIPFILPPKSNLRLARQMADEVRTGKTFNTRRTCRTFSNRCPFDDLQMYEIISNLRKMLSGQGQRQQPQYIVSGSKTTTSLNTNGAAGGQIHAISEPQGSKVEITLNLNQNGMPYGGYQMPMPMHFNPHMQQMPAQTGNTTSNNGSTLSASGLAPTHPPWPQLQLGGSSDPRYPLGHPGMMYQPPMYYPPLPPTTMPTTTTTTSEPITTTMRSPGEEQLLDFLYGVVNFNESASEPEVGTDIATKQQNPSTNPYWSAANIALAQAEDVEHELKIRDRDKDEDSKSRSSEEQELKVYIKSLKNTLKGLAQISNITTNSGEQVQAQHSSEEREVPKDDSSQEDFPIPNDDIPSPGVTDEGNSDEDEENDDEDDDESVELEHGSSSKQSVAKVHKKKKVLVATTSSPLEIFTAAVPTTKGNLTTSIATSPSEQIFDEDNEDHVNQAVKKLIEKNDPIIAGDLEDDEYVPEDNTSTATSGEEDDLESEENFSNLPKTQEQKEQDDLDDLGVSKENIYSKRPPPKILLKFEPIPPEKDPEEMTAKEKKNLVALSAALLPKVPDTFSTSPNQRQPVKDRLEEIRIPTAKPIVKAFQSVSNIGKHKIINIDEFADDSGKSPVFPRKKKKQKGARPQKMRYQTRRKPPMRRPIRVPPTKLKTKRPIHSHSNSESSEEDSFTGGGARGDFQFNSDEQNGTSYPKQGYSSKTGPLVSLPLHSPSGSGTQHQGPNFYDSLMNYMGMRPVVSKKELPAPIPGQFQYGYGSEEVSEVNPNRAKSDLLISSPAVNSFTKAQLKPQPKIGISIPLEFDMGRDAVEETVGGGWGEGEKGEDEGKKKKGKDKGKDKKKKDKTKKEKPKKDKKKKKKKGKKNKGEKGSGGYAMQFHQQVYTHQEPGIWDKIKVFVDHLASTQKGAGETPFIHLGFSESDPLDGHPHAVINDKGGSSPPAYDKVIHSGGGGDDDDDTAEEEEDDVQEPERGNRRPPPVSGQREELDLDNSAAISGPEYEGIDYDENNEEDSNESPEVDPPSPTKVSLLVPEVPYSPLPASLPTPIPTPNQVRQNTEAPTPPTTQKTTIAPKPPKYIVDRQQLKIKRKRKKQKKKDENSTVAPPIMLLMTSSATTMLPPPTSTTTDAPTTTTPESMLGKPPKRRIIYKPPAKRVSIVASPGTLLLQGAPLSSSTVKPLASSSLKSTPADWIKTRVEDDEVEPPSHFFQPGPNGQNVVGRPPIPIDAFHIQSEDMLIDTEEDEKLRGGIRGRPRPHRPRPLPPFFAQPYGILIRDGGSGSQEEVVEEDGSSPESAYFSSSSILIATPQPQLHSRPYPMYPEVIDINPEETRGTQVTKPKKHRTRHRPHSSSYHHKKEKEDSTDSSVTSSVMNSPIFSDYFKHLYSSFGQYLSSPSG